MTYTWKTIVVILEKGNGKQKSFIDSPERAKQRVKALEDLHSCKSTYFENLGTYRVHASDYYTKD